MSGVVGEVAAFVGAVRLMAGMKEAWKRAKTDGVRLLDVPGWLKYWGGKDPLAGKRCRDCGKGLGVDERERCGVCAGKRCKDCGKDLSAGEMARRMECCLGCWETRVAATRAPRSVGMRFKD